MFALYCHIDNHTLCAHGFRLFRQIKRFFIQTEHGIQGKANLSFYVSWTTSDQVNEALCDGPQVTNFEPLRAEEGLKRTPSAFDCNGDKAPDLSEAEIKLAE